MIVHLCKHLLYYCHNLISYISVIIFEPCHCLASYQCQSQAWKKEESDDNHLCCEAVSLKSNHVKSVIIFVLMQ